MQNINIATSSSVNVNNTFSSVSPFPMGIDTDESADSTEFVEFDYCDVALELLNYGQSKEDFDLGVLYLTNLIQLGDSRAKDILAYLNGESAPQAGYGNASVLQSEQKSDECVAQSVVAETTALAEKAEADGQDGQFQPDAACAAWLGNAKDPKYGTYLKNHRAETACNNGSADSELLGGTANDFEVGTFVTQSYPLAAYWHARNIELFNDACSCGDLGRFYQYGLGVPQNIDKAVALYRQGARDHDPSLQEIFGGDPDCYFALGVLYAQGKGVAQSDQMADIWFRKWHHQMCN